MFIPCAILQNLILKRFKIIQKKSSFRLGEHFRSHIHKKPFALFSYKDFLPERMPVTLESPFLLIEIFDKLSSVTKSKTALKPK